MIMTIKRTKSILNVIFAGLLSYSAFVHAADIEHKQGGALGVVRFELGDKFLPSDIWQDLSFSQLTARLQKNKNSLVNTQRASVKQGIFGSERFSGFDSSAMGSIFVREEDLTLKSEPRDRQTVLSNSNVIFSPFNLVEDSSEGVVKVGLDESEYISPVPEAHEWLMLLVGFFMLGLGLELGKRKRWGFISN
jgi:hypothetical protein